MSGVVYAERVTAVMTTLAWWRSRSSLGCWPRWCARAETGPSWKGLLDTLRDHDIAGVEVSGETVTFTSRTGETYTERLDEQ
jgi:hypothetical protein